MLRKLGENKKVLKQRMTEVAQERKIQKTLDEREKSANERELERHINDAREANIKSRLEQIRKQKDHENWKGNNFQGKATMLNDDRPMLKEKNIFANNESNQLTKNNMMMSKNDMWKGSF